jgi:tyrosine-specific transport protein
MLAQSKTVSSVGGTLLVAGCCIGAGMLGLPVVSASAGFIPSAVAMVLCCLFMCSTSLLVLEANLWFDRDVNFLSMTQHTLGNTGRAISGFLFLFLLYCLIIAYTGGTGEIVASYLSHATGMEISPKVGSILSSIVVGIILYAGTSTIDRLNRVLMVGLIAAYFFLVFVGSREVDPEALYQRKWTASFAAVPIMLISFGFQNLIPSLKTYMQGDVKRLRQSIIYGALLTLCVYLIWQGIILGILPQNPLDGPYAKKDSDMVTDLLQRGANSQMILAAVNAFAFFAIATSYLTNALSCVDFLKDAFASKHPKLLHPIILSIIVLLPPLCIALTIPNIFLSALGIAGGFAVVILFGIVPVLMVWKGRYHLKAYTQTMLPGGKLVLSLIIVFSLAVFLLEIYRQFIS